LFLKYLPASLIIKLLLELNARFIVYTHLFDCERSMVNLLESVPGTNQYWAMRVKFLAQGINGLGHENVRSRFWWAPAKIDDLQFVIQHCLVKNICICKKGG